MSQYKTGTATVTNGSATVTGTNTLWLANVTAGNSFTVAGDGVMYDVASVDSDTQITLSVAYAGVTASGVVYAIGTGFTVPDSFPEMSQGDIETATIFTRGMRKIQSKFIGIAIDKTKLDTVEDGATADQTDAEIKIAYESNADTNEFSDAEKTKLLGIEDGATADQTKADIDALNIDADTLDGIDSLGFDAAGAADTAVSDHVALADPHSQYADQANTYTETEVDNLLDDKADKATTYTETEVDGLLNTKADQANTYTETEVDGLLDEKAAISGQTFTGDIAAPKITASTGVLFGTDTAAANTLDDYERGNWTPVADSGITGWASLESATYVKIGDLVTVNVFVLSVTGKDANQIQLSGLPFASKGGRHFSPGPCEIADLSTSSDSPFVRTNAGADTLKFFKGAREDVAGNDVTGAGNIILTVTYQVA